MKFAPTLLTMLVTTTTIAQTIITGTIKDTRSSPVPGVSVYLKNSYDGSMSDTSGGFVIKTAEKGNHLLIVTSQGYKEEKIDLRLDNKTISLQIILKEEISELKAVVVSAGSFEASDRKKAAVLKAFDVVTTPNAINDITEAIKMLPGAQQVGETEGLFVRGGTAAETKTFIDGTPVNNFFYSSIPNLAQRGRFSPFVFKGIIFSAGGYSALYGQALSSALILESQDMPEKSSASIGASFLNLSAHYQEVTPKKNFSWGLGYVYNNPDVAYKIIKPNRDFFHSPKSHDAIGNFRLKTSKTGFLKYYGSISLSQIGFRENSIDTIGYKSAFHLKNFNTYHNFSWKESLGNKWKVNAGISYTRNKDKINSNLQDEENQEILITGLETKNYGFENYGDYLNAKIVLEKKGKGLNALRFGTEYNYGKDHADYTSFNDNVYPDELSDNLSALFAETDIYVTNDIAAKIGMRSEYSTVINKLNLAPRFSLAYKISEKSQASFATGIFYQNPERRFFPSNADLAFTKATHYILQYQRRAPTLRVEAFYKKYDRLIKTGIENGRETARNNDGYGEAKGIEIFWRDRKTFKDIEYWISYSYLDTKRDFLHFPTSIQPGYATRHTMSVVAKKFISSIKTQFNASYTFASGRPYYNMRFDNNADQFKILDQGKTIPFNNLSVSINYVPNVFKPNGKKHAAYVFAVTNVLNSKQVYGYKYAGNTDRKEAIVPVARMFIFLGAFFNFGIDRTQDAIDNSIPNF